MPSPITIKDVKTILTQPAGSRLIVVKIVTSEPGLYGLGCATFTQRFHAVYAALEKHLKPFLIGRDVDRIEEIWQMSMVNGYWRNGPVLNNAISGVDQALWDIKGKRAGMPLYQLLGGKCREGADTYAHAGGRDKGEVADNVRGFMEQGYRHIRVQMGGYGGEASRLQKPEDAPDGAYYYPREYCRNMLDMIEHIRATVGPEIELLHDIHERLRHIRRVCATPIAMGELFNHPLEWTPLIQDRLIDFIRMHISQMGGITPARNAAAFANIYNVRTAWHGPGDVSPVGHAANLHLDLWAPNFGIQEWCRFNDRVYELFPGTPEVRNGYMYPNDSPGLGIDIDEDLAAKYPCEDEVIQWTQTRAPDGSPMRP